MTGAAIAAMAAVLISVFGMGMRNDLTDGKVDPMFLLPAGLFLLMACAASWTVVHMSRPQVGNHQTGWQWASAMVALLPLSAFSVLLVRRWSGGTPHVDTFGLTCLWNGMALGLLVAISLVLLLRRGAPTSPARAGLVTGIAAGSAGAFAVALHCPINDIVHIGIWHAATVLVGGLAGRLIVPRLIGW